MSRTVLIIAFYFPPAAVSSGLQRALKNVRYLLEQGWKPVVLTAHPMAYDNVNTSQLSEIPESVPVCRVRCLDALRHVSIGGRYPGFMSWPDRWSTWLPGAVLAGRRLISRHRPDIIWSTFPIATTNLVAARLSGKTGIPWVADLRDPITLEGYPPDPMRYRAAKFVERRTVARASRIVFTAEYTRRLYRDRYPEAAERMLLIPNGYDEANFPREAPGERAADAPTTLVHSGSLQPKGRHPRAFFEAIGALRKSGAIAPGQLRVVLRGAGFEAEYQRMIDDLQIGDIVRLAPHQPYEDAIREMVRADGLLLFQGTAYNHAVPAKLYEYLFARKPIVGIVDPQGETGRVMQDMGIARMANIDDPGNIADCLTAFTAAGEPAHSPFMPRESAVAGYSRRNQAIRLARVLDEVCLEQAPAT